MPDIFAAVNSPGRKYRHHHRPEFLQGVLPHPFQQLWSGHMAHRSAFDFLLLFRREIERIAQKYISITRITRIAGDNRIKSFGKSNFLHGNEKGAV